MERRKFIKSCCCAVIGVPFTASLLQSCGAIYYANSTRDKERLVVSKSEFIRIKKNKQVERDYVLLSFNEMGFPICLYKTDKINYTASLLKCTHNGCELNVGGGIYTCPCHGSEFTSTGKVLQGPANEDLKIFKTETDHENIYIYLS
jgi:cytochrome b6-f complex iron-sulfur subunit